MKLFQSLRKQYQKLGLNLSSPPPNNPFNVKNVIILFIYAQFLVPTGAFLFFKANTFREFADSFYITSTIFATVVHFTVVMSNSVEVFAFIQNAENFTKERLQIPTSKAMYEQLNSKVEKRTNIIVSAFVTVTVPLCVIPKLLTGLFVYFTTDAGTDAFELPFIAWFPPAALSPIGYTIVCASQYLGMFVVCQAGACLNSMYTGFCSTLVSIAIDIKEDYQRFQNHKNYDSLDVKQKLTEFVELHKTAKQLVVDFDGILKFLILNMFLWSLLTICSSLLVFLFEIQHSADPTVLIGQLSTMFWSFTIIFFFCYFGEDVNSHFVELYDVIIQSDWHMYRIECQRMIPMILVATQQAPVLKGFGNIKCTRLSFKEAVRSSFSYFMVLSQFGK